MSAVLGLVGFSAYSAEDSENEQIRVMYGPPARVYNKFTGKVSVSQGNGIEGFRVITRPQLEGVISEEILPMILKYCSDTTYTDAEGNYALGNRLTGAKQYRVIYQDPNDKFESDSVVQPTERPKEYKNDVTLKAK